MPLLFGTKKNNDKDLFAQDTATDLKIELPRSKFKMKKKTQ